LNNGIAKDIIETLGYDSENTDYCVACLARRMKENVARDSFPHEVGFFLGYPPEDVVGFMKHNAKECKCVRRLPKMNDTSKRQVTVKGNRETE